MRSITLTLSVVGLASLSVLTQAPSPQPAPAFDVASVRLNTSGEDRSMFNFDFGAVRDVRFAGPIAALVTRGAQPYVDRPVIDATGLSGNYEWHVGFTMTPTPESEAASIFTAFKSDSV